MRTCGRCIKILPLIAALTLFLASLCQADPVVSIEFDDTSIALSKQLMLLEDPNDELDLDGAQAAALAGRFQPVTEDHLQLGYSDSSYWIRLRVRNDIGHDTGSNQIDRFYLTVGYPLLDNVEFYYLNNGQFHSLVTGDTYLFDQRYFSRNGFVFPFSLAVGDTGEIYIRVYSTSSLSLPIQLDGERAFVDNSFKMDMLDGIYVGITIGLGIYNLFLWLGVRNRVYGLYVLMVFNIMLFNTTITGLSYRFWPESLFFQQISVYFFSFTSGLLVILFGMEYLKTKESMPRFHRTLQVLTATSVVLLCLLFVLPITIAAKMTASITVITASILIVAAIRRLLQGYRPAIYYCVGQGAVIASVLFTALTSQKVIPLYHIAPEVMKWCSAIELILFSIGLADLVNNERRLREQTQREFAIAQKAFLDSQIRRNQDLDELVNQRTLELENANQQLRELNTRDELTGLRNRRYLNESLVVEYQRAYREKAPISVLILDIDFFKQLNDNHGHQFGDHCLKEAGRILNACTRRPPDIAVRYGGEEFVVVLPCTDLQGALTVAEKIRAAFEATAMEQGGISSAVTISVGVAAEIPQARDSHEALLRNADDALYLAKSQGRNRVQHHVDDSPLSKAL